MYIGCISINPIRFIMNIFCVNIILYTIFKNLIFNTKKNLEQIENKKNMTNKEIKEDYENFIYNNIDITFNSDNQYFLRNQKLKSNELKGYINKTNFEETKLYSISERRLQNRILLFSLIGSNSPYLLNCFETLQWYLVHFTRFCFNINEYYLQTNNLRDILFVKKKTDFKIVFFKKKNYKNKIYEILVKDITFSFDNKYDPIFENVSITINKRFVAVSGKSGSGKSTFLKLLLKINHILSGSITYKDEKGKIYNVCDTAYISQESCLYNGSIYDNIFYFKQDITDVEKSIMFLLLEFFDYEKVIRNLFDEELPLNDLCKQKIFNRNKNLLSGGEKQRLHIIRICAQSILLKKQLILTDEISSSLDSQTAEIVWKGLKKFSIEFNIMIINFIHPNTVKDFDYLFDQKIHISNENNLRVIKEI